MSISESTLLRTGRGHDAGFHKRGLRLGKGDYNWRLTHEGVGMPGT